MPTDASELPQSWQKPEVVVPEPVEVPACNLDDPVDLFAWFGPYGFFDYFRKVRLSSCRLVLRAQHNLANEKVTEALLDDESHAHPLYRSLLEQGLLGRKAYEAEAAKQGRGG